MANVSPNNITNLEQDWSHDASNNLPYSGAAVQAFIKSQLGVIAKASYFDPTTATLYYFASQEDMQDFINNTSLTEKVLFSTAITFSSDLFRVFLTNNNNTTTLNVATNQETVVLSVGFEVQKKAITDTVWEGTSDGVNIAAYIDAGATGSFSPIHEARHYNAGETYEFDVRNLIVEGANRVRLVFVDDADDSVSMTLTYTINLTAMFIEPMQNRWYVPVVEGGDTNAYQLGGFRIVGALNKTLHIDIYSNQLKVKEFTYNIGTSVYDQVPFYYTNERGFDLSDSDLPTGVYLVSAYLTSGTGVTALVSSSVNYNIMYIAQGDALLARLVCINNVEDVVFNYTTSQMFDYAIYNQGLSTGSPTILVQELTGTSPHTLIPESTIDDVTTSEAHSYSVDIAWITEETVNLSVLATMTFGNTQIAQSRLDNSATFPPTPGFDFFLNAASRNNTDVNYLKVVNAANGNILTPTWNKMVWKANVDGWTTDAIGRKGLQLPAGTKMTLPATEFKMLRDTAQGMTFEICYRIYNVADYNENVITIAENSTAAGFKGIRIRPTNITIHSSSDTTASADLTRGTNLMDEEVIHFVLTIYPNFQGYTGRNLVTGYINGCKNFQFEFSSTSLWNTDAPFVIGAEKSDVSLYFVRTYSSVLSDANVLANYINTVPTISARTDLSKFLKSCMDLQGSEVSYESVKDNEFNFFVIEMLNGASVPSRANGWTRDDDLAAYSNLEMHFGKHPEWDWKISNVETTGQGTTSMGYYRWNLRWRIDKSANKKVNSSYLAGYSTTGGSRSYTWEDPVSRGKIHFDGDGNHPELKRMTAKINFASSMQSHKMGATYAYTELHDRVGLQNEAQTFADNNNLPMPTVAVYEYPAFGFQKVGNTYMFIGLFTIGPDKGDKPTFGYDIDDTISDELITLEGTDHDRTVVMFNHPWNANMQFLASDECINVTTGDNRGGWEVGNCHGLSTDKSTDQAAIQSVLEAEWKPAYDVVFNNSTLIFGISLGEYGSTASATLSAINSNVATFGGTIREGNWLSNSNYQFWIDGEYILYYLDARTNQYVAGVNLVSEHGSPSGSTVSEKNEWFKTKRRERFKANAESYWDIQDALFHYAFIITIGAVDNFGKNTYPYKMRTLVHGGRWMWRQDDLDSILGINNAGYDTVPTTSEYNDVTGPGSAIYGGAASIFWTLIKECYEDDYVSTATGSITGGALSMGKSILAAMSSIAGGANIFAGVLAYFSLRFWGNAQKYFPASAYNFDANFKYERAWLARDNQQAEPLPQSLGDHYSAEYRWVYNRTAYIMSMFKSGPFGVYNDANLGQIAFRPNNIPSITVTPFVTMYPAIGNGQSMEYGTKTDAGTPYTFVGPYSQQGQTTIYINASNYYTYLGDWKDMQTSLTFSPSIDINGKKLQSFKIGDASAAVTTNIQGLSFANVPCLEVIDARNATSLERDIDLSLCTRLREAYFEGTSVPSVSTGDGQRIEIIHYPDSITTLIMRNLALLEEGGAVLPSSLANLNIMQIVNCNVDTFSILKSAYLANNSQLRYMSFAVPGIVELTANDFSMLANMANGLDKDGNTVSGGFHGVSATGQPQADTPPNIDMVGQITTPVYEDDLSVIDNTTIVDYGIGLKKGRVPSLGSLFLIYNPSNLYISFADPEVLNVLLANNIGDGTGITMTQAAAVTSMNGTFNGNTDITTFDELKYFTGLTGINSLTRAFQNSTITKVTLPTGFVINGSYSMNDTFRGSSLQEIDLADTVRSSDRKNQNYGMFYQANYVTKVHFASIESMFGFMHGTGYGYDVPFNANTDTHYVYIGGTELRDCVIPSTVNEIPPYAFYRFNRITSVTLPSSVTSIGASAFCGCSGLTGTLIIPSSVTSIGLSAFYGCSGLTGVKVLSSQVSFPSLALNNGPFAYCTGIVNMYFACSISTYAVRSSGNGTGTLIVDGVYTNESHDVGAYFASLVVNGNANFTAGAIRGAVWTALVQIRISGNYTNTYTTSADAYLVQGGGRIRFIEIGGTITHSGTYLINPNALSTSGFIIHFGYNGVALSAPAVISDFSRISNIYVGDGSSAAHDDAILAQYLADTDWATYSAKLDTWYNYVQGGGEYATPPTVPTE